MPVDLLSGQLVWGDARRGVVLDRDPRGGDLLAGILDPDAHGFRLPCVQNGIFAKVVPAFGNRSSESIPIGQMSPLQAYGLLQKEMIPIL